MSQRPKKMQNAAPASKKKTIVCIALYAILESLYTQLDMIENRAPAVFHLEIKSEATQVPCFL